MFHYGLDWILACMNTWCDNSHIARQRSAGHNFDSYRAVVRDENGLLHARVFILSIELKRRQGEHGTISLGWADSGERAFPSSH